MGELRDAIDGERDLLESVADAASTTGARAAGARRARLRQQSELVLDARRRLERELQSGGT